MKENTDVPLTHEELVQEVIDMILRMNEQQLDEFCKRVGIE